MKPIIVIPTYNEKENIEKLIRAIFKLQIPGLEIIVVDDNSPDETADIIYKLQATSYKLHLIKRHGKLGLGSAYIAGFKKALELGADYIFEMDADFSHNPEDIPRLLQACHSRPAKCGGNPGADLVIGSRKIAGGKIIGWNWRRRLTSNGAMWISRSALGLKTKDVTAGFRCFKRKVLEAINLDKIKSNGYAFQEEMLFRAQKMGFKIVEIPVTFVDRREGKSKLSKKDILEFFWIILKLKFWFHHFKLYQISF